MFSYLIVLLGNQNNVYVKINCVVPISDYKQEKCDAYRVQNKDMLPEHGYVYENIFLRIKYR